MLNCMKAILAINLFAAFAELPQFMEERSSGMRTGVGLEDEADILERRWLVQTNHYGTLDIYLFLYWDSPG